MALSGASSHLDATLRAVDVGSDLFKRIDIILVLLCLLVTFAVFLESLRLRGVAADAEFQRVTEAGINALETRMNVYLQSLNGAAGMMHASESIEADDFETFTKSLDIQNSLPGINGIGFIEPVPKEDVAEFVKGMRIATGAEFNVHPETSSNIKYIIKYIAPVEDNIEAVGLDISFETGRREAANRARQTGLPQLTPRILLVQDDTKQPGFLLLKPLFEGQQFRGWVYAPFVGSNLMANLTPDKGRIFDFRVYDGKSVDPQTLIYASENNNGWGGGYTAKYTVMFYGRPWTVHYQSTLFFDAKYLGRGPFYILVTGLILSIMLAFAMRALRQRNETLAEVATLRGKQISAREEENRSLVDNSVVAVIILDENREIIFANHAATECFCGQREGLTGLSFHTIVNELPEGVSEIGYNAVGYTMTGRELNLVLQQNSWVTMNGMRRTTVIVRDVTADVKVVKELAVTKQRYDTALAGSQIGVFEIDLKLGTSVVSDTWRAIMGIDGTVEDTQGVFMNRIHPDDLPVLFLADRRCVNGDTDRSICEYRMQFGDTWRWMKSDAVVVERDVNGKAIRMVGTQTDVTDLRHSRNALEASEQRFRTVLEAAPVGMATLDSKGFFTGVNAAMCDLSGYSEIDMISGLNIVNVMPKDDLTHLTAAVADAIGTELQETFRNEYRIVNKKGGQRWGLFHITWTYDRNVDDYVYIAQVVDITDKKKLEQIKNEFVSTVSHELRTPLTSIKGALGLIEMSARDKLPPSALRLIEIARTNSDRLTDIVNDILDLEKISSGEISFNLVQLDICELVRSAQSEMMPFAVTHSNTLVTELPESGVYVRADSGRMMQVLANLISNACKYSFEETEVKIRVEQLNDVAIVYIQNFGPGVPESFKGRIFQPFSQADGSDTRAKGGTGLGLNITRQIVKRHEGDIGFESKEGGPTVFWFTCPIAEAVVLPKPTALPEGKQKKNKRLKILHLEDDEDFAEVIRAGLAPHAEVENVTRLAKAHHMLRNGVWDVVILDWTVPDGDAAVLLGDIHKFQPKARVISLTSDAVRVKDSRVALQLVKSQVELSHIFECIMDYSEKAS